MQARIDKPVPLRIFVAEDHYPDVRWLQVVLDDLAVAYSLVVVDDGASAIDFFLKRGRYSDALDPDIALLDLNLPKSSGIEILASIQDGRRRPVCILTSSSLERNMIVQRFGLNVQCYILKPIDEHKLLEAFDCFEHLKSLASRLRKTQHE